MQIELHTLWCCLYLTLARTKGTQGGAQKMKALTHAHTQLAKGRTILDTYFLIHLGFPSRLWIFLLAKQPQIEVALLQEGLVMCRAAQFWWGSEEQGML